MERDAMFREISLGGVLMPYLLVIAVAALVLSVMASRLLANLGLYRLFAYRPLVGLALFVILLELLIRLASLFEK
jgi:hypothetical protein